MGGLIVKSHCKFCLKCYGGKAGGIHENPYSENGKPPYFQKVIQWLFVTTMCWWAARTGVMMMMVMMMSTRSGGEEHLQRVLFSVWSAKTALWAPPSVLRQRTSCQRWYILITRIIMTKKLNMNAKNILWEGTASKETGENTSAFWEHLEDFESTLLHWQQYWKSLALVTKNTK